MLQKQMVVFSFGGLMPKNSLSNFYIDLRRGLSQDVSSV
jgi:hypothetical protein